jgi:hypothetical protein
MLVGKRSAKLPGQPNVQSASCTGTHGASVHVASRREKVVAATANQSPNEQLTASAGPAAV